MSLTPVLSFKDPGLQQLYLKNFSDCKIGPASENAERPSKRARLRAVNGESNKCNGQIDVLAMIHDLSAFQEDPRTWRFTEISA